MVGPDFTADFWKAFKDNYVTREDIRFIKEQGATHASVDPIQLGYHIKAYISLEISPAQKPEVYPFLRAHPNVLECDCVTGNYSVLLKVAFPSTMELDEFIGKLQHFGKTSTMIVFSTIVENRVVVPE